METGIYISTDIEKMDIDFIHNYLSNSAYWAKGRSIPLVRKSIENSLCFGAFTAENEQVAFARVATDYVIFAWIMDVFVAPDFQGKQIGELLLNTITTHPDLKKVNGFGLRTYDAHKFYWKFGFKEIPEPKTWMYKSNI